MTKFLVQPKVGVVGQTPPALTCAIGGTNAFVYLRFLSCFLNKIEKMSPKITFLFYLYLKWHTTPLPPPPPSNLVQNLHEISSNHNWHVNDRQYFDITIKIPCNKSPFQNSAACYPTGNFLLY